jgi:hypothetical protein
MIYITTWTVLEGHKNFVIPVFEILSKSSGCVYSFPQQHAKQKMEHYFGLKKRQTRYVPLTYTRYLNLAL